MENHSESYHRRITSYFKKHLQNKRFNSPLELQKYIQGKESAISCIIKTARVYLNFCEKFDTLPIEMINKYRKFLKTKPHQPDVYVPSDMKVIQNYHQVKDHKEIEIVYLVLATSGIRLTECLNFLNVQEPGRFRIYRNYVSYPMAQRRHTKTINNIYLPMFVYEKLRPVSNTYNSIRGRLYKKRSTLPFKYLRKWHYNFMLYNNVPESVADFIQGRATKSISANHYLAKSQQADFWYSKITTRLKNVFIDNKKLAKKRNPDFKETNKSSNTHTLNYSR